MVQKKGKTKKLVLLKYRDQSFPLGGFQVGEKWGEGANFRRKLRKTQDDRCGPTLQKEPGTLKPPKNNLSYPKRGEPEGDESHPRAGSLSNSRDTLVERENEGEERPHSLGASIQWEGSAQETSASRIQKKGDTARREDTLSKGKKKIRKDKLGPSENKNRGMTGDLEGGNQGGETVPAR